ncbi:MAG: hypothetical protein MPK62_11030, partial [Alphaproteobacteria bacterium]|nr:hypothetical protein [Alphaproteobacteria bacterium]
PKKMTFQFPDYISIKKWIEWMEVEWKNDLHSKVLSISIVSGKPVEEIRKLPAGFLAKLYEESINMMKEVSIPFIAIKYKGERLYFSAPTLSTIGEVADIEHMLASEEPYGILKVLFRPCKVDQTDTKWEKYGEDIEIKPMVNFEEQYKKYAVEKYDINSIKGTKIDDDKWWDDFPHPFYAAMEVFISGTGITSLVNILPCSQKQDENKMTEMIANLNRAGASFRSYMVLRKVTFSDLQETNV